MLLIHGRGVIAGGGAALPGPAPLPARCPARGRRLTAPRASTAAHGTPAALPSLGGGVGWAVEVTRHTLTLPQVLQHLQQLEHIEASAAQHARVVVVGGGRHAAPRPAAPPQQRMVSWVEQRPTLMDGVLSESDGEDEAPLDALAALPRAALSPAQQAALALAGWRAAAHTKPAAFDADATLTLPGLASVAVVSRGGWQRHGWKGANQDAFLALPLAAAPAACPAAGAPAAACAPPAVAIGVFDGHGRAGGAASAHLRNALASGLLAHSQLAQLAQPACESPPPAAPTARQQQQQQQRHQQRGRQVQAPAQAAAAPAPPTAAQLEEASQLLERCFAAAASTMPSTGADFSLSGSTAVLCLVQPGAVTAAWAGDSRAVLGLQQAGRYIACALTHDHRPSSPLERARIEACNGWVMQTMLDEEGRPAGPHRVYLKETNIPGLAVSRCFGDYVATGAGVTSTPDVTTLVLPMPTPGAAAAQLGGSARTRSRRRPGKGSPGGAADGAAPQQGQPAAGRRPQRQRQQGQRPGARGAATARHILIVASDGLWEFVSSAEAVRVASRCATAAAAAEALAAEAQAHWAARFGGAHCDDITVAVAFMPGCEAAPAAGCP